MIVYDAPLSPTTVYLVVMLFKVRVWESYDYQKSYKTISPMSRDLTVLVESDTSVRLIGECTRDFKDAYLGARRGWSWQGGRFNGQPPHWVWGVKRGTIGGIDASIHLVGQLLHERRIDKVFIDYTAHSDDTKFVTPPKRANDADPQTVVNKVKRM